MAKSILGTLAKMLITKAAPVVIDKIAQSRLENEALDVTTEQITALEVRVAAIEERNARVEADKAWETSLFRKVTLGVLTYVVIALYLWYIKSDDPFTSALVPAVGFFLSTLTLPFIRDYWVNNMYKK